MIGPTPLSELRAAGGDLQPWLSGSYSSRAEPLLAARHETAPDRQNQSPQLRWRSRWFSRIPRCFRPKCIAPDLHRRRVPRREKVLRDGQRALARDSRRTEASTRHALACCNLRSICVDRGEVCLFEIWVVGEDFILCHAGCQHIQNVRHGDPKSADAGLPRSLARHHFDPCQIGLVSGGHTDTLSTILEHHIGIDRHIATIALFGRGSGYMASSKDS